MRRRNCDLERRIGRLKQLGRLADLALPPASADVAMRLIADELWRLGIFTLPPGPVNETDIIH